MCIVLHSFVSRALPAGKGFFPASDHDFKQPHTALALPIEITTTCSALLKIGMVNVPIICEGGGLGLFVTGITIFFSSCKSG